MNKISNLNHLSARAKSSGAILNQSFGSFSLWVGIVLAVSLYSCGKSGDDSGIDRSPAVDQTPPQTSLAGATELSGQVFLGTSGVPARGYQVWLLNHKKGTFEISEIDANGNFLFPLNLFESGGTFNLELLDDQGFSLGSYDLSSELAGLQSGFSYTNGGFGADLGSLVIALDVFGFPDKTKFIISGSLSGGFNPITGSYTLSTLGADSRVKTSSFGSLLKVRDPQLILNSFYNSTVNPTEYGRALSSLSGFHFAVEVNAPDKLSFVRISDPGGWARGSLIYDSSYSTLTPWDRTDFRLIVNKPAVASSDIILGGFYPKDLASISEITLLSNESFRIVHKLSYSFSMIPKVASISRNGASATAINYSSSINENGLTRPFKWSTGDIVLSINSPTDSGLNLIKSDVISNVDMIFTYYKVGADGALTTVVMNLDVISEPFDKTGKITESTQVLENWDSDTFTLKHDLIEATTKSLSVVDFNVYGKALAFDTGKVDKTRVEIIYHDENSFSSTVIWFKK